MNVVPPTGFSNGASRSDTTKFFSQSENDVAAAFAELLKHEGITPSDEPAAAPPPPASDPPRSKSDSSTSLTSNASDANRSAASAPAPSSASNERPEDEADRDDEEEVVASAAIPVPAHQQQTQADAKPTDGADSTEEAELEAILGDVRDVQQELDSSGAKPAPNDPSGTPAPVDAGAAKELVATPQSAAAAANGTALDPTANGTAVDPTANGTAVDPTADASPRVNVPAETEIVDPSRRMGTIDEESDTEEGFAIEDSADGEADEEALAALLAKAAATAETAKDGKTDGRDAKPKSDRGEKADAAVGVDAAVQAAGSELAADASAAVIVSTATSDVTASTSKADGAAVDAVGTNFSAGSAARHETPGSLHRSIERPSEADRRQLHGADRSRFFDRVERAFKSAEQGDGSIRMRLHPAELGSMQLTLEKSDSGEWIARIQTETQEAKHALLEHAGALKERLADQDFRLARIEVETPADRRQQNAPDFQENPQSFSRGREQRDDDKRGEDRTAEAAPVVAAPGDRSRRLDVTI